MCPALVVSRKSNLKAKGFLPPRCSAKCGDLKSTRSSMLSQSSTYVRHFPGPEDVGSSIYDNRKSIHLVPWLQSECDLDQAFATAHSKKETSSLLSSETTDTKERQRRGRPTSFSTAHRNTNLTHYGTVNGRNGRLTGPWQ
jgi:hypothetical protein